MSDPLWFLTKDGDASCLALFRRHYSCRNLSPKQSQFVGPGEHIVLRTDDGDAVFVWRRPKYRADQQEGVECTIFRNESSHLSSELIRQADAIADRCWPRARHYTFVDPKAVRGSNPGYCFLAAGWRRCFDENGEPKLTTRGLLVLERLPPLRESTFKPGSVMVRAPEGDVAEPKKITNALYLPDWTVEDVDRSVRKKYVIKANYDVPPSHCPKCGSTRKPYGHGTLVVPYIDAPVHGRKTTVDVTVQRYRCRDCRGTFMQPLPDTHPTRTMMLRCVEHIGEQAMFRTYAELGREIGLDESTVREVANEEIDRILENHRVIAPVALGIDELTINDKKRTIFTDIGERRVLDLIETMDKPDVVKWLRALPNKNRIRIVTIDMWGPYETAIAEVLGDKVIVITDKWHVVSKANAILDVIRNAERRKGKTKKERKNPQRGRRLLQTSRHKLSPWRLFILDGVLKNNPRISAAWHCKESFYDIWGHDERPSRQEAEKRFDAWKATITDDIEEFREIARMIDKRRETMFAYFDRPYTNAYTEAANGLIKITNRAGRGYRFKAIRARAITLPFRGRQRLAICEECLGQFPVEYFISPLEAPRDRSIIARWPQHHGAAGARRVDNCTRCRQFHTDRWLSAYHRSTLKTG